MAKIFTEENGVYAVDCTKAVWATDQMHEAYHTAGIPLKDADFLIESETEMYVVEYKNANIPNAVNPQAFQPEAEKRFRGVVQKFYDSLHYLNLLGKTKPIYYIYVLEYPNGDRVTRKRLRNRMKQMLPFRLQEKAGSGRKLIESVDVVSIDEWNHDKGYGRYPIAIRDKKLKEKL